MRSAVLWLATPATAFLVAAAWGGAPQPVAGWIRVGAWGGLLGTAGYDVVRVPFWLLGVRVFAPISCYGVWIADASASSRMTEAIGWGYHVSNGVTFGVMYALWMHHRHWAWGILWGLALETIALLSPFRTVFGFTADPGKIAIAYLGHVAYGLPLGLMVQAGAERIASWRPRRRAAIAGVVLALICGPILWPGARARDSRNQPERFEFYNGRLTPEWLRVSAGSRVRFDNVPDGASIEISDGRQFVASGPLPSVEFDRPGIFPVGVRLHNRVKLSFIIVEPVAAAHDSR